MKIALVYLYVLAPSDKGVPDPSYYVPFQNQFFNTYAKFKPSIEHERHLVFCGAEPNENQKAVWPGAKIHTYLGHGKDIGAHQWVAQFLDCDFAVHFCTTTKFIQSGWLERLVEVRTLYGNGLYGTSGSYENSPHIRTGCFAMSPALMRRYPIQVDSIEKAILFESCQGGFTTFVTGLKLPVLMVTNDGAYPQSQWRMPDDIFRRGDQHNCLVWDRHMEIYAKATPQEKEKLAKAADGKRV